MYHAVATCKLTHLYNYKHWFLMYFCQPCAGYGKTYSTYMHAYTVYTRFH